MRWRKRVEQDDEAKLVGGSVGIDGAHPREELGLDAARDGGLRTRAVRLASALERATAAEQSRLASG